MEGVPEAGNWAPIHTASHHGDVTAVQEILAAEHGSPTATWIATERGDLPIHLAAHRAQCDTLAVLAAAGQSTIDAVNHAGWTPLMLVLCADAPPARRLASAQLLLAAGASCHMCAPGGWSPVLMAAQRGDVPMLAMLFSDLPTGGAAALTAARTAQGDGPLHLAAHAGSVGSVRLLLSAGVAVDALNARGLDATELAINAACNEAGDLSDASTARFEDIIALLRAAAVADSGAAAPGSASVRGLGKGGRSGNWGPLHTVAGASAKLPLRRLFALASALRRAGCNDCSGSGHSPPARALAEGEHDEPGTAAELAVRAGRPALAALIRAPPPPPLTLLALRRPLEGHAPKHVLLVEGSVPLPTLPTEGKQLHRATLKAMSTLEHSLMEQQQQQQRHDSATASSELRAQAQAEYEEAAAAGAVARVGGSRCRWRSFGLLAEIYPQPPSPQVIFPGRRPAPIPGRLSRDDLEEAQSLAVAARAVAARESLQTALARIVWTPEARAARASAGSRNAGAEATGGVASEPVPPAAVALPRGGRRWPSHLPVYCQSLRWMAPGEEASSAGGSSAGEGDAGAGGGGVEVLEVEPQRSTPLLHTAHLELLREVLGRDAIEREDDESGGRHWAIYAEDLTRRLPHEGEDGGAGGAGGAGEGGGEGGGVGCCGHGEEGGTGEGWQAVAEVFSLDTPLLLAFATEASTRRAHEAVDAAMHEAHAQGHDEHEEDDDDDEGERGGSGDDEGGVGGCEDLGGLMMMN